MYNKESTKSMQNESKIYTAAMRTVFFVGGLAVLIHICSSIWISFGLLDGRTWLRQKINALHEDGEDISEDMHFDSYMLALYFTI